MTRVLIRNKREFRARADRAAFSSLIATPVAGAFTMPASGKISFVSRVDTIEGDDIATVQGATLRELKSPGAVAGMRITIDHIEKDAVVAAVQNVDVYLDNGLGVWSKIAEGAAPPVCSACLGAWTTDTIVAPLQPLISSGGPCFHTAETPENAPAGTYAASAQLAHFQTINWSTDVLRVFVMEPLTTAKIGIRSDVALSLTLNSLDGSAYTTAVTTNSTGIRVTSYYQFNERNSVIALPADKYFVGIRGDGAVIFGTADDSAIMTDSPGGTAMVPLDTAKLWLPAVSIDANREIEGIIKGKVITNASEMSTADFPDLSGYGITEVQDFCGAVVTN